MLVEFYINWKLLIEADSDSFADHARTLLPLPPTPVISYLEDRIKTLRKGIEISSRLTESSPRNFPLPKFSTENLSPKQGKDPEEKKQKDKERNDSFDRIDERAQQVLKRFPVPNFEY